MKVNLAGVQEAKFDALPKGKYRGIIFNAEEKETAKGDPMLVFTLKVSDEHPDEEFHGRQAWLNHPFVENALPFLKASLIALGEDATMLDTDIDVDPEDFVGREIVFECGAPRQFEGEARTQVRKLWPAETDVSDKVPAGESVDDLANAL